MSVQDQLSPYLNRFVTLLKNRASAKLELQCQGGKVTINIFHDLGEVEETVPKPFLKPTYTDILKNNVNMSQQKRLQRRAAARAEEALKCTKEQQKIAGEAEQAFRQAKLDAEEARADAEKAKNEAEKAKNEAEKAKYEAEEAKQLAEKAKKGSNKHKSKLSKQGAEEASEDETSKSNTTLPLSCDSCGTEFMCQDRLKDHIEKCNVCEITLPETECLTEHNWNEHPELLCEDCGQYMLDRNDLEDHKKKCFQCLACNELFYSEDQIEIHQRIYPNKECDGYGYIESEEDNSEILEDCDICEELFKSKGELSNHKDKEHTT